MTDEIAFGYVDVPGTRLHVAETGRTGEAPTILLHGFPEFWFGWRHQIGPLSAAIGTAVRPMRAKVRK